MVRDLAVVLLVIALSLEFWACWWLVRVNYKLAAAHLDLRRHVGLLQLACDEACTMFSRYAAIHDAKGTPEGDKKAQCNAAMAASLTSVLNATGFDGLGPMQQATLALRREAGEHMNVG